MTRLWNSGSIRRAMPHIQTMGIHCNQQDMVTSTTTKHRKPWRNNNNNNTTTTTNKQTNNKQQTTNQPTNQTNKQTTLFWHSSHYFTESPPKNHDGFPGFPPSWGATTSLCIASPHQFLRWPMGSFTHGPTPAWWWHVSSWTGNWEVLSTLATGTSGICWIADNS